MWKAARPFLLVRGDSPRAFDLATKDARCPDANMAQSVRSLAWGDV
jgi:hypothetical protein